MHSTQNTNDEAVSLAGVAASSFSGPAAGSHIIQFPFQAVRRRLCLEDAIETEEDSFQSLGSVAIRLVADWSLPRLSCWRQVEEPHRQHSS